MLIFNFDRRLAPELKVNLLVLFEFNNSKFNNNSPKLILIKKGMLLKRGARLPDGSLALK